MPTPSQLAARPVYQGLMEELVARIAAIDHFVINTELPGIVAIESAYLQPRMCFELVAIGCLFAHGDIPATRSSELTKAYNAEKIFKALGRLHGDFFPRPYVQEPFRNGFAMVDRTGDVMTKSEMIRLYNTCGKHLHRGSLKTIQSERMWPQAHAEAIAEATQRMANLLTLHMIRIRSEDAWLACAMKSVSNGGTVQTKWLELVEAIPSDR